jgi:hypothetical protein
MPVRLTGARGCDVGSPSLRRFLTGRYLMVGMHPAGARASLAPPALAGPRPGESHMGVRLNRWVKTRPGRVIWFVATVVVSVWWVRLGVAVLG